MRWTQNHVIRRLTLALLGVLSIIVAGCATGGPMFRESCTYCVETAAVNLPAFPDDTLSCSTIVQNYYDYLQQPDHPASLPSISQVVANDYKTALGTATLEACKKEVI